MDINLANIILQVPCWFQGGYIFILICCIQLLSWDWLRINQSDPLLLSLGWSHLVALYSLHCFAELPPPQKDLHNSLASVILNIPINVHPSNKATNTQQLPPKNTRIHTIQPCATSRKPTYINLPQTGQLPLKVYVIHRSSNAFSRPRVFSFQGNFLQWCSSQVTFFGRAVRRCGPNPAIMDMLQEKYFTILKVPVRCVFCSKNNKESLFGSPNM